MYVELHSCSAFSFLEGASLPEDLIAVAAKHGMSAMALLDRDGVYGAARFHVAAKKCKIRAHIGAEISVDDLGSQAGLPAWLPNQIPARPVRLPLLVRNQMGYRNLCRLITKYKLRERGKEKGTGAAMLEEIAGHTEGLVCLTGGEEGILAASLAREGYEGAQQSLEKLAQLFGKGNVYVELQRHFDPVTARRCYEEAVELVRGMDEPLVLAHVVRHLGDVYLEQGHPDLAEPCYHEARNLYFDEGDTSSLDFANAIRSLALLRWEQSKALWKEAQALYASLRVGPGVDECEARVNSLSIS